VIDAEVTQQHDEIGVRLLEQLEQPVLDFDVIVGARDAQTHRGLQGLPGGVIEPVDQLSQIDVNHWPLPLRSSATRDPLARENCVVHIPTHWRAEHPGVPAQSNPGSRP